MEAPKPTSPVVVLQAGQKAIGITVDELIGRQEIVIKALGPLAFFQGLGYSGAAIDPEGRIMLVLDVERLLSERTGARILAAGLSRMAVASSATETDNVSATADRSASRILLIDDSLSVRKFIGRMLQAAGYQVDTAVDGEEGLRKAALESYRLIITDLEMPRMTGYELMAQLRQSPSTRRIPVMVVTSRAGAKHRDRAMKEGAVAFLTKPVQEDQLTEAVEQLIGTEAPHPVA